MDPFRRLLTAISPPKCKRPRASDCLVNRKSPAGPKLLSEGWQIVNGITYVDFSTIFLPVFELNLIHLQPLPPKTLP
jgi:hypothetical protein